MNEISQTGFTVREDRSGAVSLARLLDPMRAATLSAHQDLRATGFSAIDSLLSGGLAPEELVVVGGRPGVGKSVAVVQWARNLAVAGRQVVLACYEHSELVVMAQLLLVELGESVANSVESVTARAAVDRLISGQATWEETVANDRTLAFAAGRLDELAPNIALLDRRGRNGGFAALRECVDTFDAQILVVDHLQKVGGSVGEVAIGCKQLAVETGATVIAATTSSDSGLGTRRLRPENLVDAATVAHEADIQILLNDKMPIVSRNHSAFDTVRAESFRNQVVFTIEKNRRGTGGVDVEFTRDFAHRRFDPTGGFVSERLIDEVMVRE